jgi:S-disulfanyl-L-cysteine oxidoreductase SoxD
MQSFDLKRGLGVAGLALFLSSAAWATYPERPDNAAFGQPIAEEDLDLWDIEIHTPSGAGLPEGEGTVAEGEEVYAALCLHCHGENAEGGSMYGTMVGGIGSMTERPRVLTPGSMYPYAPILFDYVHRAMPLDAPHSMTPDEVYAVAAYLYHLNGLIEEDFVMNAETMPTIEMPNRDAFFEDDRPDTEAERCMEACAPIGTVEDGDYRTADAEDAGETPDPDAAEVQGGGTGGQVIMGDADETETGEDDETSD